MKADKFKNYGSVCNSFRILWFVLSISLCIWNTYHVFDSFVKREKTIAIHRHQVESYYLPTFVICAEKAFKDTQKQMFTLEDFRENTVNPKQFLRVLQFETDDPSDIELQVIFNQSCLHCVIFTLLP